jgi:hypothetical protein
MASPTATQHIRSGMTVQLWDHDPGAATAILVSPDGGTTIRYIDMRDYSHFAVAAMSVVLTGAGITKLEIVASATTDFSAVTVIKDSGTVAADAEFDWVMEECTAAEVAQEGADAGVELRYVAGRITEANSADEAIVAYIGIPKRPQLNLTPATTIS